MLTLTNIFTGQYVKVLLWGTNRNSRSYSRSAWLLKFDTDTTLWNQTVCMIPHDGIMTIMMMALHDPSIHVLSEYFDQKLKPNDRRSTLDTLMITSHHTKTVDKWKNCGAETSINDSNTDAHRASVLQTLPSALMGTDKSMWNGATFINTTLGVVCEW